jgi:hypothetical protein
MHLLFLNNLRLGGPVGIDASQLDEMRKISKNGEKRLKK